VSYALYLTGVERWVPGISPLRMTAWAMNISCVLVLLPCALDGSFSRPLPKAALGWGALMALLSTVIPTFLLTLGIRKLGAGPAAVAGSLGPISTIFLAWIFLGETLTQRQWAGALLVIGGVLLLGKKKPEVSEPSAPEVESPA
jgi:drug/metabolite transporter (DMT)-like permease